MERIIETRIQKFWAIRVTDDEQSKTYLAYPAEFGPYRNTYSCVSAIHPAVWKFTAAAEANDAIKKAQALQTDFAFEVVPVEIRYEITFG